MDRNTQPVIIVKSLMFFVVFKAELASIVCVNVSVKTNIVMPLFYISPRLGVSCRQQKNREPETTHRYAESRYSDGALVNDHYKVSVTYLGSTWAH